MLRNSSHQLIYLSAALVLFTILAVSCKKDKLHWQKVEQLDSHTTDRLCNILFTDNNNGFIAGGDRFYKASILSTTDGGNTWQYKDMPEAGKCLYGLAKSPWGSIYICGFESKLLHSTDGGNNWIFNQLPNWQPCKDMAFNNDNTGIIIGGASFNYGSLTYIDSAGNITRFDTLAFELNDIEMLDGKTGFISGFGAIMKTTDGGYTWDIQDAINDDFMAITALNENELWACGINGSIMHTVNGGKHWEKQRNGNDITIPRYRLLDILFKDALHGYAVGENGIVIYTDDGGDHWMEYDKFTDQALRTIALMPSGDMLVAGDGGTLYRLLAK